MTRQDHAIGGQYGVRKGPQGAPNGRGGASIMQSKPCAKLSWRDSAGIESCPAKVSRPAGIDVDVSGGNEWCEASQIADGQPQRK